MGESLNSSRPFYKQAAFPFSCYKENLAELAAADL